jgi:hypothetical protein
LGGVVVVNVNAVNVIVVVVRVYFTMPPPQSASGTDITVNNVP